MKYRSERKRERDKNMMHILIHTTVKSAQIVIVQGFEKATLSAFL